MKGHILFVNQRLTTNRGGGETVDIELGKKLKENGYIITYLTQAIPGKDNNLEGLDFAQISYIRMPDLSSLFEFRPGGFLISIASRVYFQLRCFLFILQRRGNFEYIHTCSLVALAWWTQTLLGKNVYSHIPGPPDGFQWIYIKRLRNPFANGDVLDLLHKNGVKALDVPLGVSNIFFDSYISKVSDFDKPYMFIYVGRLVRIKNVEMIIEAFSRMTNRNSRLKIVGGGPLETDLKSLVLRLGQRKRVSFRGTLNQPGVVTELLNSDCFVMTSHYENLSNSTAEAMAVGLPILATNVGGFKKQVKNGVGGFLVGVDDVAGLCSHMDWVSVHRRESRQMGKFNHKMAQQKYSWDNSAKRLISYYKIN